MLAVQHLLPCWLQSTDKINSINVFFLCCVSVLSTSSGVRPWIRGRSPLRLKLCSPETTRSCLRVAAAPRRPRTARTASAATVRAEETDWERSCIFILHFILTLVSNLDSFTGSHVTAEGFRSVWALTWTPVVSRFFSNKQFEPSVLRQAVWRFLVSLYAVSQSQQTTSSESFYKSKTPDEDFWIRLFNSSH